METIAGKVRFETQRNAVESSCARASSAGAGASSAGSPPAAFTALVEPTDTNPSIPAASTQASNETRFNDIELLLYR
jgi:hypothetical protein